MKIYGNRRWFFQWDTGQKLVLPCYKPGMEVHFSNKMNIAKRRDAIVMYPKFEDNQWLVNVPDEILQEPFNIIVHICGVEETKLQYWFRVRPRSKPDSYVYEESEILQYKELDARMDAIEKAIENGGLTFDIDENTLKMENNVLSVNTTNLVEKDNTQPITSAGVHVTVGNIDVLLRSI